MFYNKKIDKESTYLLFKCLNKINTDYKISLLTRNIKYKKKAFSLNCPKNCDIIDKLADYDFDNLKDFNSGTACFSNSIKFISLYGKNKDLDLILNQISNGNDLDDIFSNDLLNIINFFGKLLFNTYILVIYDTNKIISWMYWFDIFEMFLNTYVGFKYGISVSSELNYHYISINKKNNTMTIGFPNINSKLNIIVFDSDKKYFSLGWGIEQEYINNVIYYEISLINSKDNILIYDCNYGIFKFRNISDAIGFIGMLMREYGYNKYKIISVE